MYRNVGAHKNKAHNEMKIDSINMIDTSFTEEGVRLVVDEYIPETLSSLLSKIKQLLRNYRSEIVIKTIELNGTVETIEINAKIQINR